MLSGLQLTFRLLCNPDSHVLNVSSLCISSWLFCCCNSCFFSSFNLFPILSSAPPLGVRCLFLLSSGCSDTTSMISSFSLTYERKMEQSELLSSILRAFGNCLVPRRLSRCARKGRREGDNGRVMVF